MSSVVIPARSFSATMTSVSAAMRPTTRMPSMSVGEAMLTVPTPGKWARSAVASIELLLGLVQLDRVQHSLGGRRQVKMQDALAAVVVRVAAVEHDELPTDEPGVERADGPVRGRVGRK